MGLTDAVNPRPFLTDLVGKACVVRLKWGEEYHGLLAAIDQYMNVQLASCAEYSNDAFNGNLGDVLIRCNNILYIRQVPEDEEDIEAKAEAEE